MTVSLFQSDADFLMGISVDQVYRAKLAYRVSKYSASGGIRCLTPIIRDLRSIVHANSGVTNGQHTE
jgi:hypothetical protein